MSCPISVLATLFWTWKLNKKLKGKTAQAGFNPATSRIQITWLFEQIASGSSVLGHSIDLPLIGSHWPPAEELAVTMATSSTPWGDSRTFTSNRVAIQLLVQQARTTEACQFAYCWNNENYQYYFHTAFSSNCAKIRDAVVRWWPVWLRPETQLLIFSVKCAGKTKFILMLGGGILFVHAIIVVVMLFTQRGTKIERKSGRLFYFIIQVYWRTVLQMIAQ